jgi:hypothetical protein
MVAIYILSSVNWCSHGVAIQVAASHIYSLAMLTAVCIDTDVVQTTVNKKAWCTSIWWATNEVMAIPNITMAHGHPWQYIVAAVVQLTAVHYLFYTSSHIFRRLHFMGGVMCSNPHHRSLREVNTSIQELTPKVECWPPEVTPLRESSHLGMMAPKMMAPKAPNPNYTRQKHMAKNLAICKLRQKPWMIEM